MNRGSMLKEREAGEAEKGRGLLFRCIMQCELGLRRSNYLPVRLIVHPYASGDTRPGL